MINEHFSLWFFFSDIFHFMNFLFQINFRTRVHKESHWDVYYNYYIKFINSLKNYLMFLQHWIWTSLVAQTVKRLPTMWKTRVQSLGREDPLKKEIHWIYKFTQKLFDVFAILNMASLMAQSVNNLPAMQETACNAGDMGSISGSRRFPGEGNSNPF